MNVYETSGGGFVKADGTPATWQEVEAYYAAGGKPLGTATPTGVATGTPANGEGGLGLLTIGSRIPVLEIFQTLGAIKSAFDLFKGGTSTAGATAPSTALVTTGTSTGTSLGTGGVPFGGPGVPEPPNYMVSRTWKTKAFSNTAGEYWVYFWRLIDGRVLMWNAAKREAKIWKPKKNLVLSANPRLPQLLRITKKANRMLFKLDKQADKARRLMARK